MNYYFNFYTKNVMEKSYCAANFFFAGYEVFKMPFPLENAVERAVTAGSCYVVNTDTDVKKVLFWSSCWFSREQLSEYSKFQEDLQRCPEDAKFLMTLYRGQMQLLPFSAAEFEELPISEVYRFLCRGTAHTVVFPVSGKREPFHNLKIKGG